MDSVPAQVVDGSEQTNPYETKLSASMSAASTKSMHTVIHEDALRHCLSKYVCSTCNAHAIYCCDSVPRPGRQMG
jgi:hypothetical protein